MQKLATDIHVGSGLEVGLYALRTLLWWARDYTATCFFCETPYRCVAGPVRMTVHVHVNALSRGA